MPRVTRVLASFCAASVFAAGLLWLELRSERARNHELQARVVALEAAVTAAAANTHASHSVASPATAAARSPSAGDFQAPGAVAAVTDPYEESLEYERHMLAIPQYREARKAEMKAQFSQWREDAIRIIGMTPSQADKVVDLMVESQLDWSTRPHPGNDEEAAQRRRQGEEDGRRRDAAIREAVGDAKAAQWDQYVASLQSRAEVRQLRARLASGGEPLRPEQIEPLVSALHAERAQLDLDMSEYHRSLNWDEANRASSGELYAQRRRELQSAANERSRTAAASILSTAQLAALDAQRARQQEMELAREQMERIQQENQPPTVAKSN